MTADVFRALADPTRRDLLDALRNGPATTGSLAAAFETTRFAVMKHLQVLLDAGLVTVERRGRERWNYLDPVPLRRVYERWLSPYTEGVAVTALALQRAAEAPPPAMAEPGRPPGDAPRRRTADPPRPLEAPMTDAPPHASIDVRTELRIAAPPPRVFAALTEIGSWWPHRSREGSTVVLEIRVGGRFLEDWGDGDGRLYGVVQALEQGRLLQIVGPMGVRGPVVGVWTLTLDDVQEDPDGTLATLTHQAFGDLDPGAQVSYTEGWGEVLAVLAERSTAG